MIWQDRVLFLGNLLFLAGIVAMAVDRNTKVRVWMSAVTAVVLAVAALTVHTLGLPMSAAVQGLEAGGWAFIAVRRRA